MKKVLLLSLALLPLLTVTGLGQTPLTSVRVASGVDEPVAIASSPGDPDRLFIVLRKGKIRVLLLRTGELRAKAFLDIQDLVDDASSEQGLLGLVFHPDYENNGYFYVNYTNNSNDTVIARYQVKPNNPNVADDTTGVTIIGPIDQPYTNHNAGDIHFGHDGMLYIALGDGGSGGDPGCRAQDGQELLGKMLRLDVDSAFPYDIPPDNPYLGDPDVLDEIWAFGLRNPWRYSFDRETGDLWIADVGQNAREEISFAPGNSTGAENYGWKIMEAFECYGDANCDPSTPPCNDPSYTDPIYEYNHSGGKCSITGGYVYRGCAIPDLQGSYFFADWCSDDIWSLRYDGSNVTEVIDRTVELIPDVGDLNAITAFGEDDCGELYIASQDGGVYKIVPDVPAIMEDLGYAKEGGNGETPHWMACGLTEAGSETTFRLWDAPASQCGILWISDQMNPVDGFGGTLVPLPPIFTYFGTTDADGRFEATVPGGIGDLDLYMQWMLCDPPNTSGIGFSNAILVHFES